MTLSRLRAPAARRIAQLLLLLSPLYAVGCGDRVPTVVDRTVSAGSRPEALATCAPVPLDRPLPNREAVERLADEALGAHANCAAVVAGWNCFWDRVAAAIEKRDPPPCAILGESKP